MTTWSGASRHSPRALAPYGVGTITTSATWIAWTAVFADDIAIALLCIRAQMPRVLQLFTQWGRAAGWCLKWRVCARVVARGASRQHAGIARDGWRRRPPASMGSHLLGLRGRPARAHGWHTKPRLSSTQRKARRGCAERHAVKVRPECVASVESVLVCSHPLVSTNLQLVAQPRMRTRNDRLVVGGTSGRHTVQRAHRQQETASSSRPAPC